MQNQEQTPGTEIATLPPAERAAVVLSSSKTEQHLKEIAAHAAQITTVIDAAGREEAHRAGMQLKTARTSITKRGKEAREDAQAFCQAVISEEKRLIGIVEGEEKRVLGLRDAFDAKLAAERAERERIERERVEKIKAKIELIRRLPAQSINDDAATLRATLDDLGGFAVTEEEFAEFADEAAQVVAAVREAVFQLWNATTEREQAAAALEAERAELARQKALQEEEDRKARELRDAEAARLQAEREAFEAERRAFQEQQESARRAEEEKIAAIAAQIKQDMDDIAETVLTAPRPDQVSHFVGIDMAVAPDQVVITDPLPFPGVDIDSVHAEQALSDLATHGMAIFDGKGGAVPVRDVFERPRHELLQAVRTFTEAIGCTTDRFNVRQTALYTGLQFEELAEKVAAVGFDDFAAQLDGIGKELKAGKYDDRIAQADRAALLDADIDLAWVSLGSALSQGADVEAACDEVARSNLAKIGPDGAVKKDGNGKVMKPEGWTPPELAPFVNAEAA